MHNADSLASQSLDMVNGGTLWTDLEIEYINSSLSRVVYSESKPLGHFYTLLIHPN